MLEAAMRAKMRRCYVISIPTPQNNELTPKTIFCSVCVGQVGSDDLHKHLSAVESQIRDIDAHFTSEYHAAEHASDDTVPKMVKLQADMSAVKGQLGDMQQQIERLAETVSDALRATPAPSASAPVPRVNRPPSGASVTYAYAPHPDVLARQEHL